MIEPRGAVRWLLSKPRRRALIPVELAQHIEAPPLNTASLAPEVAAPSPRQKRPATQVPDAVRALQELYPSGPPPTANRGVIRKAVEQHIGRGISLAALDRARDKAWPS